MRGGRGEGGERRGAAAAAERCNAKRVLLGGEGAEVHLLGCTPSTSLCTPSSLYTPSSLCTPSGKEQLRRPRTSSTHQKQMPLSSLQKVHLLRVLTLLPVHTPSGRSTGARRCTPLGGAHLREVLSAQANHAHSSTSANDAHVLHSCAVMCRLLQPVQG